VTRSTWLAAAGVTAMVSLGALGCVGTGVASAKGEPCVEDPQDCGFAPTISDLAVNANRPTHVELSASIDAGDQKTAYEVWISYAPCQGGAGECPKPIQKELIASGSISYKKTRTVIGKVGMLTVGCTYGYWFVATNGRGTLESEHEYFVVGGAGTHEPKECTRKVHSAAVAAPGA